METIILGVSGDLLSVKNSSFLFIELVCWIFLDSSGNALWKRATDHLSTVFD